MSFATPSGIVILDFHEPGAVPAGPAEPPREDLSAVACTGPYLWLASDETASIERLGRRGRRMFGDHRTFHLGEIFGLPAGTEEEIDIEGLATDCGWLWVVGSHSTVRKKPKPKHSDAKALARLTRVEFRPNRHFVGRIPIVTDAGGAPALAAADGGRRAARLRMGDTGNALSHALRDDVHLGRFLEIPAKENGFDVEGIAAAGDRLFLGLRGPVLRGWAVLLEITAIGGEPGVLDLVPTGPDGIPYRKHFLDLGGLGIRDLTFHGDDLLILAGPSMDLDGPVSVVAWPEALTGEHEQLVRRDRLDPVLEVPYGAGVDHAEGIALFNDDGQTRLLVVYDTPAPSRCLPDGNVLADLFALDGRSPAGL